MEREKCEFISIRVLESSTRVYIDEGMTMEAQKSLNFKILTQFKLNVSLFNFFIII